MFERTTISGFAERTAEHYESHTDTPSKEQELNDRVKQITGGTRSAYIDYEGKMGTRTRKAIENAFGAKVSATMPFADLSAPSSPSYDVSGTRIWFIDADEGGEDGEDSFGMDSAERLVDAYDAADSADARGAIEDVLESNGYNLVEETIVFAEKQ